MGGVHKFERRSCSTLPQPNNPESTQLHNDRFSDGILDDGTWLHGSVHDDT
jgi:hypothetical protein